MKKRYLLFLLLSFAHGASLYAQTESKDSVEGASYDLQDLVVTADKPLVQTDGSKLTYNLEEDPSTKSSTLLDALRKVPMVSVDGDDNIRINGQQNFKIYVNGKEEPSLTANYKNVFKAMPANAVVRVEVITEPGAKYDAEGTAGILNLVTQRKNDTDGYFATVSANFSRSIAGGSLYGRMKRGRLALSAGVDYGNSGLTSQKNIAETDMETFTSVENRFQKSVFDQNISFDYIGARMDASYDLCDNDLLTASFSFNDMGADLNDSFSHTSMYDASHNLTSYMRRTLGAKIKNGSLNVGASWQHSFNAEGRNLILSYQYNHGTNRFHTFMTLLESQGEILVAPYQSDRQNNYDNEHTVQLDFKNPFSPNHLLETGGKAIFRRNDTDSYLLEGADETSATEVSSDYARLNQIQDIYALYASYNGKFGNYSATAGLRYEHTRMGIDYLAGTLPGFMNHLNDLVPNAAVAYNFTPMSNLRLSYQMRISRPSLSQVNPYRMSLFPQYVRTGNPDLESEKANKLTLTYSNFGRTVGGNIGVEYSMIDNAISQYIYVEDNTTYESYGNIGHDRSFSAFGMLSWSPLQRMQLMVNARATRKSLSSHDPDYSNSGWTLNYTANASYSLPSGIRLNAYGGQTTRTINLMGHSNGWYYYGLGISKGFLKKDALTVSLTAANFLQKEITYRNVTTTHDSHSEMCNKNRSWNVGVSVSWNFGTLKSDVKKTGARILNDDRSSVSNQSQGSNGI